MKYIIVNLLIVLLNMKLAHMEEEQPLPIADCTVNVDMAYPPIFLDKSNPKNITFVQYSHSFVILKNQTILALCPGGMVLPDLNITVNTIKIKCANNIIYGITNDGKSISEVSNLKCDSSSRYEIYQKIGYLSCSYNYYAVGIKVLDQIYEFAQICFDLRAMRPIFVRYHDKVFPYTLSSFQTDIATDDYLNWGQMDERYKSNIKIAEDSKLHQKTYVDLVLPSYNFFIPTSKYEQLAKKLFKCHADVVFYRNANLFASYNYPKYLEDIFTTDMKVQSFVGWDTLIYGNWQLFLDILHQRTCEVPYEVFMGTSHIAQFPNIECFNGEKAMIIEDNGKEIAIPQYVWAYLRNDAEKVVIIGVNTPYYPVFDQKNELPCESLCTEITWLRTLVNLFNLSSFGLMYCCPVQQVYSFLDGFPNE